MSMFGCTCCDGVSFGNPCCISYTEPIYGYSPYTPLCGQPETCGQSTRIVKLYDLPRNLRFCTPQGASACYVRKVTETFSIATFDGCPPYEYETIRYLYPNQACLTGEVLEDGTICNQIGDPAPNPGGNGLQTRTIERVLGKIDLQSSCWRRPFNLLRPYAYMKQITENETKIDLNWYRWWEDFCPSCDNCKGVSITPDEDVCVKGKNITYSAKEVFSSNYCISYEEKLNTTTGVTSGVITYSCDPIDGGKHYSVNDKEWKDGLYCFGGECLVPYIKIDVVSLEGVSGIGPCFPGINKCFISVDESEVYERPNPKDGPLTQSSINGGCTPQVCLNGYIFGTSNPCELANPCLFDGFTLADCPGECPPDDDDDEEEGPSDVGSIF